MRTIQRIVAHKFVDGPDGIGYHCRVCGISRCDDHVAYTCREWFTKHPTSRKEMGLIRSQKEQEKWRAYWIKHMESIRKFIRK